MVGLRSETLREPFEELSGGAQEQLARLMRLGLVARICEWRLGRGTLHGEKSSETDSLAPSPFLSLEEIVLCLQRIRSSVRLWNNEGGRQGYLRYVSQFLSDAERMAGNG